MPPLAVSIVDVLEVVGFGAAGFLVVALVCAGILAMLQVILPSTDSGAVEADRKHAEEVADGGDDQGPAPLDTEANV
ncbi:MAG: hypothetical protein M3R48_05235 [Candidatus Dormibacteraeota bacterium]|nr:hypothetical protein [Candidatus Dormibacteraeota bacterium]